MDDVIVIDDAVSLEVQESLEKICLSDGFGWIFNPFTTYSEYHISQHGVPNGFDKNAVDTPLFTHLLWSEFGRNSHYFNNFVPVIHAIPYEIEHLSRFKVNLTLPHKNVTAETHSFPHVDYRIIDCDLVTAIYYINDSDGDTVIFNEVDGHQGPLSVKQKISPRRGRLVVFDGRLLHAGNNPSTDRPRLVGNINIIPKNEKRIK